MPSIAVNRPVVIILRSGGRQGNGFFTIFSRKLLNNVQFRRRQTIHSLPQPITGSPAILQVNLPGQSKIFSRKSM